VKAFIPKLSNETIAKGKNAGGKIFSLLYYLFLIDLAFVFMFPFLYMLSTSLKSFQDLNNISVTWLPTGLSFKNYIAAAQSMSLILTVRNSVTVTGFATLGHLFAGAFIGYGFARFEFPFRKALFFGVILSAVIPTQVSIVPLYITYSNLKMLDTFFPLILPTFLGFGLRGGIFIFLFRQYFYGFPSALEDAAMIDGCGRVKSFFRIALPSAGPVIVVTTVLSMVWHWNDYYEPSLYLTSGTSTAMVTQMLPQMYNLLAAAASGGGNADALEQITRYHEGVVMAATVIALTPLLIVYLFLQKKFITSIERTGLVG